MSKIALKPLNTLDRSDSEIRSFLQTHKVPSTSNESSSELVPFTGRLCTTLAEHVLQIKTLFAESSPDDPTISTLSATLPEESSFLTGKAVLEILCAGFSLFNSPIMSRDTAFQDILIDSDFVPLLKSTIVTCLDLLEHKSTDSICQPTEYADLLINILNNSWECLVTCLSEGRESFRPVVESAFSDVPQLCSLLERTCCHFSPALFSHLRMIINISAIFPRLIPRLLEENLIQRVINTTKPMTVPTTDVHFHLYLVHLILNLIWDEKNITKDKEDRARLRKLQFERVFKPAKQYLQIIVRREEFIPTVIIHRHDLPHRIALLLKQTLALERDLFEDGEIVETGREEWEVVWLMEKTDENALGKRLKMIREVDVKIEKNEKERWKKRVERQREAGHEDALEGWLLRRDNETRSEIVQYVRNEEKERGMNGRL
ncbi:hypothetical protein BLNAU_14906 [Blattamonas nauphoetae]|uniref:Uncharacterized protein n=1 Tax=Blattamonas nauphoetae TaxID=2049346 RepID=A0ABQ9XEI5_9EUKA|nr:hypothetical protein BLNAU_14906 [Blattamonas nauphoetae]